MKVEDENKLKLPLEASTRLFITDTLSKLGYILDESSPDCNIYQERAKTVYQDQLLRGKNPDFTIYQSKTDKCLAVIEAKRPGIQLDTALEQAINLYAIPLNAPVVFITNRSYVYAYSTIERKPLKIDNIELQEFVDEETLLKFISNNFELQSVPSGINYTREELLDIFADADNLLRKAGLREGYERFSAFSDLLFLKLKNDFDDIGTISDNNNELDESCNWSKLIGKLPDNNPGYEFGDIKNYLNDTIKPRLRLKYGDAFDNVLNINNENVLKELVKLIDTMDFNAIDTDIKGDAFEFFLKNVTNGNKDLGEYYTPRHIVKMIIKLINPKFGDKIYDPCCGTGGFLLESYKHLMKNIYTDDVSIKDKIKKESIYGRELTSTARTAKMNMILFGDGHSNIIQIDSLSKPVDEEYNIVVSNIPFSQKVDYGALYPFPSDKGDSIFVQHMWKATKPGGTMAVIVQDPFFYDTGDVKSCRDWIMRNCTDIVVISLPRGVFNPYTPTKTSILIAKKQTTKEKKLGKLARFCYFYNIRNDGFELTAKRRPLSGISDCSKLLAEFNNDPGLRIENIPDSINVPLLDIINSDKESLFSFDYMESLPPAVNEDSLVYLGNYIKEKNIKFNINEFKDPSTECAILSVTKNGIYIEDIYSAEEINDLSQKYKKVSAEDIVYNPHRINIGSIGVVPELHKNMYVPPIYPVFRITNNNISPYYIVKLLKSKPYQKIIRDYCRGGARANLSLEQLGKIKFTLQNDKDIKKYKELSAELKETYKRYITLMNELQ